ncbi:MAG: hypothetical protein GX352_06110 [Clostridiales bacterium]|nr:hypothetical protein [Clostridiales bacterium]
MDNIENIGTRRELLVDEYFIHSTTAKLVLHQPTKQEICFRFDAPYEGTQTGYQVIIHDGEKYRLYYTAKDSTSPDGKKYFRDRPRYVCCIESTDGTNWVRPSLGIIEYENSKDNNIVFDKTEYDNTTKLDNFIPFIDTNPSCPADQKYKAFEGGWGRLSVYKSSDGYHWTPMFDKPLSIEGTFDSSNLAFWDPYRQKYWAYVRSFHNPDTDLTLSDVKNTVSNGIRDISWCESGDFINWSAPQMLDFGNSPDIPLYSSSITQYYRAPHMFIGFPMRYIEREWSSSYDQMSDPIHRKNRMKHDPRYGLALTDCVFMSSRDGKSWRRTEEAYLRPGIANEYNWIYGDGDISIGMCETESSVKGEPKEISVYSCEKYWKDSIELRRYTIRPDGFMSLYADGKGHETSTKTFVFEGNSLTLNVSTTIIGGMKIEFQDISGNTIEGYSLSDCDEIIGDRLDYTVSWKGSKDISVLAGRPVRMRFYMKDVNLYSFKFEK